MSWQAAVDEIERRKKLAYQMGGGERVERQHREGKYTVRERIERLLDPGTFEEVGVLAGWWAEGEGGRTFVPQPYVAGMGKINGRDVAVGGEDFTVRGGSAAGGRGSFTRRGKQQFLMDLALEYRIPLITFQDGAGANVASYEHAGGMYIPHVPAFYHNMQVMNAVPVVRAVTGPAAGAVAAHTPMAHLVVMSKGRGQLFAAGPPVVRRALGENVTKEELGGWDVHCRNGVADLAGESEDECFDLIRRWLGYFPQNVWEAPPHLPPQDSPERRDEELLSIVPTNRRQPYDMRKLIGHIVDRDSVFEVQPLYAQNLITCYARLNGHAVGVVANNPQHLGGALDAEAADKQCRFVEMCDYFHIPLLIFADIPGFMIGTKAERAGTLRKGMRLAYVLNQLTVPMISLMIRKAYGMGGTSTGNPPRLNLRIGWPSGDWGSIPLEGGVDAAFRRDIESAPDPAARRRELEERFIKSRGTPFNTAESFDVEMLIDPRETRPKMVRWLEAAMHVIKHELGPKAKIGARP
ncbi:MAG: propionyl-CoA carboxylase [Chloroflexi bacterium]|nr:propionyl-CoA carboxylase [Chloroflexota bacterium]